LASAAKAWQFGGMVDPSQDLALAAEFPATDRQEWLRLVRAALKDRPFEKLVSKSYDGLSIEPLYERAAGAQPIAGRAPGRPWQVLQRVDHPDPAQANKQALEDLENGATGLVLVMAGSINANGYGLDASPQTLARTLEGVELDAGITIDFNLSPATRGAVGHFVELVKQRGLAASAIDMRASINPVGGFAVSGTAPGPWHVLSRVFRERVHEMSEQGFRGPFVVADGRVVHNAGGSEAQELAFALASAVEYLRALSAHSVPLDAARKMIYFRLAADADEFLTIAKFRSLRKLWARVEEACGLEPKRAYVAAETAWRMMTRRDPYVNMLRTTIAVTAAGLGGADSILALPHTAALGLPDAFARRVARNTQLVLLEESNLYRVADPAAGSGGIEDLTARLCAAAWAQFQDIEKAGGVWKALETGLAQQKVAAVRAERQKAVARRKDAIVGVSDFPNLHEDMAKVLDVAAVVPPKESSAMVKIEALPRIRLAEPFEALRDKADAILAKTGARPKVFLATLGKLSDFNARAMFAKNFYEAGGIEAIASEGYADVAAMIAAFKSSGARIACLCSSDKVYAAQAAEAAAALKQAGAIVHLAGRPGEHEAAWNKAGVHTYIYVGCDALSTLRAAHDMIAKP
jgi:methylmalonyl-CoA mutase